MLEEQRLDRRIHDVKSFTSGAPELDIYLQRYATQDRKRHLAQIYVLVETDRPKTVLGYYTLSAAQIDSDNLAEEVRQRLPRYPIPCFRMGRLAVDTACQGQGMGKVLLGCAVDRCLQVRHELGAYALLVDAESDAAKRFYVRFGFQTFTSNPMSLYLVLS